MTTRKQLRAERKAKGLCIRCGAPAVNRSYCEVHRVSVNEQCSRRSRALRAAARGLEPVAKPVERHIPGPVQIQTLDGTVVSFPEGMTVKCLEEMFRVMFKAVAGSVVSKVL